MLYLTIYRPVQLTLSQLLIKSIHNFRATLLSSRTNDSYASYEKQVADLLLRVNVVPSSQPWHESHPLRKIAKKLPQKLRDG